MTFTITVTPIPEKLKHAKRLGWCPLRAMEFHVIEDDYPSAKGHIEDMFPFLKSDEWSWSYGEWDRK